LEENPRKFRIFFIPSARKQISNKDNKNLSSVQEMMTPSLRKKTYSQSQSTFFRVPSTRKKILKIILQEEKENKTENGFPKQSTENRNENLSGRK
jgi:hypothetical protein